MTLAFLASVTDKSRLIVQTKDRTENTDATDRSRDVRRREFLLILLGSLTWGNGRALLPFQSVITGIVGQVLDRVKRKRAELWSPNL